MKINKTAVIVHGGGVKGAFAAGVMYGLSEIGIKNADIIIGTSSSAATAAYFTGQQFEFMKKIWTEEVGSKNFVSYMDFITGKPVFNLCYLIGTVFKKKYPIDIKNILESNSLFIIPLYNYKDGKVEFFSNHEGETGKNFWKILQTAMTVHDRHIDWNGPLENFVDADLDPFAIYRREIIPNDWNVLTVINHKELHQTIRKWAGVKIFQLFQSRNFPEEVKKKLKIRGRLIDSGFKLFEKFVEEHHPIIIDPPQSLKLSAGSVIVRDKNRLSSFFDIGVKTVRDMENDIKTKKDLEVFINRSNELSNLERFL